MGSNEKGNGAAGSFEKLLEAFERYRELENRAIKKIKEQLAQMGIEIPEAKLKEMDRDTIRGRLLETRKRRIRKEQEAEKAQEAKERQGPDGHIR